MLEISNDLLENTVEKMSENLTSMVLATSAFTLTLAYLSKVLFGQQRPPDSHQVSTLHYSSLLQSEQYGPVVSFTMVGKTFTYLLGSDSAALMFNSKNEELNAEDVYSRLTTPVFGKGVAYDVPNPVFLEQKKMLKTGLNIAHFKKHVEIIEEETREYFQRWGDSGERNLFEALSELIIVTASRCLHGREIRRMLDEKNVAQLYADLDGGFTHAAWLLPGWLPLPSFRRRDHAHREIKNIFYKVIEKRRQAAEKEDDILQTLMDETAAPDDDEIAGMLIESAFCGQHTSSTPERCFTEQNQACGRNTCPLLDYDQLKDLNLLDRCGRVHHPGLGTRCACLTTVNHRYLSDTWTQQKFAYIPFGAGDRHRCIGENFAYVQIKNNLYGTTDCAGVTSLTGDGYFPTVNYTTMIHTPNNPIIRYRMDLLNNK
uniref:Cytochrome P450, family 51 n=1 Tax=Astyanax mexicanus TaxID=7994 RepID=A0A3B1JV74_ASTMX